MLVISTSMSLGVITFLRENNNLYIVIIVGGKKKDYHILFDFLDSISNSNIVVNYETRCLFPNKIHPPATTACSIVAAKLITECNELLSQFLPATCPPSRERNRRSTKLRNASNRETNTRRKIIAAV